MSQYLVVFYNATNTSRELVPRGHDSVVIVGQHIFINLH
jgi:hypothetical protein